METQLRLNSTTRQRHCWECMRRRLVCDFAQPACHKCRSAGINCPGYDEKKPLKWLAPGKVASRAWQRRSATGAGRFSTASSSTSSSEEEAADKEADLPTSVGHELLGMSLRMRNLKSEACTMVEAAYYFNNYVYPDFLPIHELVPNPYLGLFPLEALHHIPMAMCYTLVYLTLGHRIHRVFPGDDRHSLMHTRSTLYQQRGLAIRSLAELMGSLSTSSIDITIGSILLFLFVDARQVQSMDWKHHFTAATELIKLRGGLPKFARSPDLEPLKPLILHLLIVGVTANTTTPPSQHIPTTSQLDLVDTMNELYGDGIYPILLCPPYLFIDMIKINSLRFQVMTSPVTESTKATAHELLEHIEAFSPENWTEERTEASTDTKEDWLLLGRIYRSSVALYCISSLQSLGIIPSNRYFTAMRTVHGTRLFTFLQKALTRARIKSCMIWPVVVAGMQAVDASPNIRHIVDEQLAELGQSLGTPAPLWASAVFHRFWASGKTGWDDCFDRAHVFVS